MAQSGLRHAATEPDHLDAKRERSTRRGGGGRTAVLRRAPSDSDCSAETASLSADSADRVRPQLVPIRTTKNRSRRRGSEWEVLEGLKDGQRFERRPEVFNGYLHKKRKWPLKGWHKRFFVIDGGILVYARSPTDVARGRLHGSVDVGLSVISAKARRRRIDIDADEFIYHLRAKTPDVFRTWLNVLKAHRLYRQHLLTFGAREAVPKIHAPPADNTPTSSSSFLSSSSDYSVDFLSELSTPNRPPVTAYFHTLSYHNPVYEWTLVQENDHIDDLIPLTFENFEGNVKHEPCNRSLCSLNCLQRIYKREIMDLLKNRIKPESVRASIAEQQLLATELERNSLKIDPYIESSVFNFNSPVGQNRELPKTGTKDRPIKPVFPVFSDTEEVPAKVKNKVKERKPKEILSVFKKRAEPTATYFLFAHKRNRQFSPISQMKRSKKSTNLVKYRNCSEEPPLDKPFSVNMLLKKGRSSFNSSGNRIYKVEVGSGNDFIKIDRSSGDESIAINKEVQASVEIIPKRHQSLQDTITASEYDKITEQLVISIFGGNKPQSHNNYNCDLKCYVNQMVKELYQVKIDQTDAHPVKILFRSLLEYWLKNSLTENMRSATKTVRSGVTQSKIQTRDKNLSGLFIPNITKETQIQKSNSNNTKDVINALNVASNNKQVTLSYMKERQIQELETLLKNTIYSYESANSRQSKIKDIRITKRLLDNLESRSINKKTDQCDGCKQSRDTSSTSAEFMEIKENVDHMISEISIPPECVKEFLEAYLKVLNDDSENTPMSGDSTSLEKPICCDVQTESVSRKVSVGVYAVMEDKINNNNDRDTKAKPQLVDTGQDSGQIYLKDVIEKVTSIFAKQNDSKPSEDKFVQPDDTKAEGPVNEPSLKDDFVEHRLMFENTDENSVVIDLTKYDLERISMGSDPTLKGTVSVTIKLKERTPDSRDIKQKNVNLIFSEDSTELSPLKRNNLYPSPNRTTKNYCRPKMDPRISFKNPYIHYEPEAHKEKVDLKSVSASDATSKAFKIMYENDDLRSSESPDLQPHNIMSPVKRSSRSSIYKSKKKWHTSSRNQSVKSLNKQQEKISEPVGPIDENFIILLLENLTLLSQNVPGLYKDINVFYLKLKRRHEKQRNTGVGLLGKIYNESYQNTEDRDEERHDIACACYSKNPKSNSNLLGTNLNDLATTSRMQKRTNAASELKDTDTQCDKITHQNATTVNLAVSTSSNPFSVKQTDKGYRQERKVVEMVDIAISSPNSFQKITRAVDTTDAPQSSPNWFQKETKAVKTPDVPLSGPNWFQKMTRDCAMTTAIRSILIPENSCANFRFVNDMDKRRAQICEGRLEAESPMKQILKSPKKTSIESKTKRKCVEIDLKSVASNKSSPEQLRRRRNNPNCVFIHMTHQDDAGFTNNRRVKYYNAYPMLTDTWFHVSGASRPGVSKVPESAAPNVLRPGVSNVSSRELGSVSDDVKTIYRCSSSVPSFVSRLVSPSVQPLRAQAGFVAGTPGGRLANWIVESGGPLEVANRELGQAQLSVQQLQRLLDAIELSHHHHDTDQVSLEGASPNVKKDRRKFGLRKKKSNSKCASVELTVDASASHTALSALTAPPSPGGGASSAPNSAASLPIDSPKPP